MNQALNVLSRIVPASILLLGAFASYSAAARFDAIEYNQKIVTYSKEDWVNIPIDPAASALDIAFRFVVPCCMTAAASFILLRPTPKT